MKAKDSSTVSFSLSPPLPNGKDREHRIMPTSGASSFKQLVAFVIAFGIIRESA